MGTIQYSLENVVTICAGFSIICGAVVWVIKAIKSLMHPNEVQDKRLTEIEKRLSDHDQYSHNDQIRISKIEEGNRVTQRAILALLAHGIDGNEIGSMKRAKDDLEQYLINR